MATVQNPVRHILTIAALNLTGLSTRLDAPKECDAPPTAIPCDSGSSIFSFFSIFSPKLAPMMPVRRLRALVQVASDIVTLPAAIAKGVVIHRVNIEACEAEPTTPRNLAPAALVRIPVTAVNKVDERNLTLLFSNRSLYWYSCTPKLRMAVPRRRERTSPGPCPPPKYEFNTGARACPVKVARAA